jgi:RHS repeat-associated protein
MPIDQLDLGYDAEGNITSKKLANGSLAQDSALTATYDAANRMTGITVSGKTYALTYDANGNLTGKQNTADVNDTTTYQWDNRNRLTGITAPGLVASFAYDPLGRRIERTVNGEATAYLYDGIQAIGEVRGGQATALLTGLAVDEAIARYASSGRLTQLTDQLGSVIRQINEAGATQSATAYSPYGEAVTTGDDQGNSTEYTARENDGTGLYFYRARYYDPVLKRFVSEDPIGVAGGMNLYQYAESNPISKTDPLGLAPKYCGKCATLECLLRSGNLCEPVEPPPRYFCCDSKKLNSCTIPAMGLGSDCEKCSASILTRKIDKLACAQCASSAGDSLSCLKNACKGSNIPCPEEGCSAK